MADNEDVKETKEEEINFDALTIEELRDIAKMSYQKEKLFNEKAEEIKKMIADAEARANDFKDKWFRTSADFENFKKRNESLRKSSFDEGKMEVLTKILAVGDNLERALKLELDEKTKSGVELVYRQFNESLASLNVVEIEAEGKTFDPNLHNAVMQAECDDETLAGTVKDVFLKGYKMGDKIIRYSTVCVNK